MRLVAKGAEPVWVVATMNGNKHLTNYWLKWMVLLEMKVSSLSLQQTGLMFWTKHYLDLAVLTVRLMLVCPMSVAVNKS